MMNRDQLKALKQAAVEMAQVSTMINEMDNDASQIDRAILTAQTGCMTALVHIVEILDRMEKAEKFKNITGEFVQ